MKMLYLFLSIILAREADIEKMHRIDQEIVCLAKEKKQLERKASSHRNAGSQLQFDRGNFLEARREFFLEQELEDKIHILEIQIEELLEERKDLILD
jgi:hypothetical protein